MIRDTVVLRLRTIQAKGGVCLVLRSPSSRCALRDSSPRLVKQWNEFRLGNLVTVRGEIPKGGTGDGVE